MHDNTFTMIENIAHLMVFENYKKSLIVASEASNVFIFSGQKFSKNGKNGSFLTNFELAVKQCYQTGKS